MSDSRTKWWRSTHAALMRLLYEQDPDAMGASVLSPEDEYYDLAVQLMRALNGRTSAGNIQRAVTDIWPNASVEMLGEVTKIWQAASDQNPFDSL